MKKLLSFSLALLLLLTFVSCKDEEKTKRYDYNLDDYMTIADYNHLSVTVDYDEIRIAIDTFLMDEATSFSVKTGDKIDLVVTEAYLVEYIGVDARTGDQVDQKGDNVTSLFPEHIVIDNVGAGTYCQVIEDELLGMTIQNTTKEVRLTMPSDFAIEELQDTEIYLSLKVASAFAKKGLVATVTYTGYYMTEDHKIDTTQDPFDSDSADFYLGAGMAIEDFENGVLGMEIGETKKFEATFPSDYSSESLQNQTVIFECTLDALKTPEVFNDAYAKAYYDVDTTAEVIEQLIDAYARYQISELLLDGSTIKSYPEKEYAEVYQTAKDYADYLYTVYEDYCVQYNMEASDFFYYYMGMSLVAYTKNGMQSEMIYYYIARKENLVPTEEDVANIKQSYIEDYASSLTSDEMEEEEALRLATAYVEEDITDEMFQEKALFLAVDDYVYAQTTIIKDDTFVYVLVGDRS